MNRLRQTTEESVMFYCYIQMWITIHQQTLETSAWTSDVPETD